MGKKIAFVLILLLSTAPAWAGNKKLMSINAAKILAERAIVESIVGLKIKTTDLVESIQVSYSSIEAKTAAAVKEIKFKEIVYDREKDIAKVVATINAGRVKNIVGKDLYYGNRNITRVAFATSTPGSAASLKAMRAAEMDAYKQMAKKIIGFTLSSNTRVENYITTSDEVRTRVLAAIWGANFEEYRWDGDGDAYIKLSLRLDAVEDVFGQKIFYSDSRIIVEGMGASVDDYSANRPERFSRSVRINRNGIKEASLDIPVTSSQPQLHLRKKGIGGGAAIRE